MHRCPWPPELIDLLWTADWAQALRDQVLSATASMLCINTGQLWLWVTYKSGSLKERLQRRWVEYSPIIAFMQRKRPVGQERSHFLADSINKVLIPLWERQYRTKTSQILIPSWFKVLTSRIFHFLKAHHILETSQALWTSRFAWHRQDKLRKSTQHYFVPDTSLLV